MKKYGDGRIGFNSKLEHRLIERLRGRLKSKDYKVKTIFNNKQNTIIFEAKRDDIKKIIYGQFRTKITDYVSMNRKFYDNEKMKHNDNVFIVLVDRRHLYPMKFIRFCDIKNVIYMYDTNEPYVLIPECEFKLL